MTTAFDNGTIDIITTFFFENVGGSYLLGALVMLGIVILLLLATRMPAKFIGIFTVIGLVSIFGGAVPLMAGYKMIVMIGILILLMILYAIYAALFS